jgi:hypothetical protein
MSLGLVVDSGPLVPGGGLTYVLYLLTAVWLVAVTSVMVVRLGKRSDTKGMPNIPEEFHNRIEPRAS